MLTLRKLSVIAIAMLVAFVGVSGAIANEHSAAANHNLKPGSGNNQGMNVVVGVKASQPHSQVGEQVRIDVTVAGVNGGVGAYRLTVGVEDASVAKVTSFDVGEGFIPARGAGISSDSSEATLSAFGGDTDDRGKVTIGSVTLESTSEGTTVIDLSVSVVVNEAAHIYSVRSTVEDRLTVRD